MQKNELHDVYLSLGSNLADKKGNIIQAIKLINERIGLVLVSSAFYTTTPVGFESDNDFINAACLVLSNLEPEELLTATQEIEKDMGRTIKSKDQQYADRIIDIDILFYDDLTFNSEILTIPHPHLHERLFVIDPMSEIAGDYIHPVLKKSIENIRRELNLQE